MIEYFIKRSAAEAVEGTDQPPQRGVWAVGSQVTAAELEELAGRYGLNRAILRDVLDYHELPRIEAAGDRLYIFIRTPQTAKYGEVMSVPLLMITNHDVFFSITIGKIDSPLSVLRSATIEQAAASGELLLGTLAATVSRYESFIKKTASFIRDTGHRLRSHEATNSDFIYFVTIEDNLNQFQRDLSGMLAVSHRLKDNLREQLSAADMEALDDISLHIEQLLVSIGSYSQSIASIRNAYSTVANNILNQRMKLLTTITVLMTLPNVFFGMYGMNVALPFADQPWAFGAVVGVSILLIVLVLLIARRSRIL